MIEYKQISMTQSAVNHMNKCIKKIGEDRSIRLGVANSGCSGMSYTLKLIDKIIETESDEVFENSGIKIVIDKESLVYLNGVELDYVREGLNEGFKFNNPNVKNKCGCGESFNV